MQNYADLSGEATVGSARVVPSAVCKSATVSRPASIAIHTQTRAAWSKARRWAVEQNRCLFPPSRRGSKGRSHHAHVQLIGGTVCRQKSSTPLFADPWACQTAIATTSSTSYFPTRASKHLPAAPPFHARRLGACLSCHQCHRCHGCHRPFPKLICAHAHTYREERVMTVVTVVTALNLRGHFRHRFTALHW